MPKDTRVQHFDEKAGDYKPERKQLHAQIVKKFLEGKQPPPPGQQKVAIVMMGGTASGKTTTAKRMLGDKFANFVNVNADDVKEQLPEYQQGIKASARDAAASTHDESADVAEDVLNEGVKNGHNLLVDGTGKTAHKHIKRVQDLQKLGYHVHLMATDLDPEEAVNRAKIRAEQEGRYVPVGEHGHPDIVRPMYQAIPKNFETVARTADEFSMYNTREGYPEAVWSGRKGQQDTHHNPQFVQWFQQQHGAGAAQPAGQPGGQPIMAKSETGKQQPAPEAQQPAQPYMTGDEMRANLAKVAPEEWAKEPEFAPQGEAVHAPGHGAWWPTEDIDYEIGHKDRPSTRKRKAAAGAQGEQGEQAKPKFTIKDKGRGGE